MCRIMHNVQQLFGDIDMCFPRDFMQLPPTTGSPLYSGANRDNTASGKTIWQQCLNKVVFLRQSVRQNAQDNLAFILREFREGHLEHEHVLNLLNSLVIKPGGPQPPEGAVEVYYRNADRCDANSRIINSMANNGAFIVRSVMMFPDVKLNSKQAEAICTRPEQELGYMTGNLDLAIGMPVMIMNNYNVLDGIANGTAATVRGFAYDRKKFSHYRQMSDEKLGYNVHVPIDYNQKVMQPKYILVEIKKPRFRPFRDLPPNVYPIPINKNAHIPCKIDG
jgi:hypothetical protein